MKANSAPASGTRRPRGRTRVFGVLGGVASGKSRAAELLAGPDGVVIDADRHVRELYASREFSARLARHFGRSVLGADGTPDRAAVASRVFADSEERAWLEREVHPPVRKAIREELARARQAGAPVVVLDVPLLLENEREHGLVSLCEALIFVDAPAEVRERRAIAVRGWSPGEVARREAAQMPLDQKRARAQHVVLNDGDLAELERAVARVRSAIGLEPSRT